MMRRWLSRRQPSTGPWRWLRFRWLFKRGWRAIRMASIQRAGETMGVSPLLDFTFLLFGRPSDAMFDFVLTM